MFCFVFWFMCQDKFLIWLGLVLRLFFVSGLVLFNFMFFLHLILCFCVWFWTFYSVLGLVLTLFTLFWVCFWTFYFVLGLVLTFSSLFRLVLNFLLCFGFGFNTLYFVSGGFELSTLFWVWFWTFYFILSLILSSLLCLGFGFCVWLTLVN